jgi:hypothetical protein
MLGRSPEDGTLPNRVEALLGHYGLFFGVRNARKHLAWYMDRAGVDCSGDDALRKAILTETNFRVVMKLLRTRFSTFESRRAA